MKILFDTSVLVGAILEQHPRHSACFDWLAKVRRQESTGVVCTHSLLEFYAVITSYPTSPGISPGTAKRLIQENIVKCFEIVELDSEDYAEVINNSVQQGFIGGVVYDALIFQAALKSGMKRLLTLNGSDFRRFSETKKIKIIQP